MSETPINDKVAADLGYDPRPALEDEHADPGDTPASTAGEQDHADPWAYAGDETDPPADCGRPADDEAAGE